MLKRMKKVYDTEFHEVNSDWDLCKEGCYKISSNENEIKLFMKCQSVLISGLSLLECTYTFNIRWDDDNLGIVNTRNKNRVGTIAKIDEDKYFFLLRRMNFYA